TYRNTERLSPDTSNILVMGPWVHGGWARETADSLGDVSFGSNTAAFYQKEIELPFFNAALKGDGTLDLPEAYMFETGRNQWQKLDAWPPKSLATKSLYFDQGSVLSSVAPATETASAFDEYVSDPRRPVPLTPGIAPGMPQRYMDDDQRHAA